MPVWKIEVCWETFIYIKYYMWQDLRKGTISRYSRIFILKRLYLWNHSSYELQTWHEYSSIILLHSLQIADPAHFRCGRSARASIAFENRRFMPHFGGSPLGTGGLLRLLRMDLWSRRSKLLINQARSLGLLRPWNGDSLKNGKKSRLARNGPFSQILSHIFKLPQQRTPRYSV